jgi:hypothetical protein
MPKLVVNVPNRPVGSMVGVPSIGYFENGKEHEVSDRVKKRYESTGRIFPTVVGKPLPDESPPPETPSMNTFDVVAETLQLEDEATKEES